MSRSILIVEDDAFTGRMMEIQFRKAGFEVTSVSSGEEALTAFTSQSFDLVLTDVMMPGISGLEVLRKIRETHSRERLPVILLTALSDAASILEGLELGASDFMGKTNEFGIILAKVKHHLEVKQLHANTSSSSLGRGPGDAPWNWNFLKNEAQFSSRFHQLLGYANKELGSDPDAWLDRIHPEDRPRVDTELDAHRGRRKAHFEVDYRIQHKDGHYFWVHSFGIASFSREGSAQRILGSLSVLETIPNRAQLHNQITHLDSLIEEMCGDDVDKRRILRLTEQLREDLRL